jgi:hypothetical protein
MEQFGAQIGFPFAAAVGLPFAGEGANFTAIHEPGKFNDRLAQDLDVARAVVWRAESSAHGVIDESAAGRRDLRHDVERRADHKSGDAAGFDDMGYETDGLVTKGSVGDEQGRVDSGAF